MATIFLLAAVPVLLILGTVVSGVVCIYIFAKAHGNIRSLDKKKKAVLIFFAFLPFILIGLSLTLMSHNVNEAHDKLSEDIASGTLTLHKVNESINTSETQIITLPVSSAIPQLSFEIFKEYLYVTKEGQDIKIKTKEFADIAQLTKNDIGHIGFIKFDPSVYSKDANELHFKKEKIQYTKQETAIGTAYQSDQRDGYDGSGRFVYQMFFNNVDYVMTLSVGYNSENDLRVRYSPLVSKEYANNLFKLMTSTLKLQVATPIIKKTATEPL